MAAPHCSCLPHPPRDVRRQNHHAPPTGGAEPGQQLAPRATTHRTLSLGLSPASLHPHPFQLRRSRAEGRTPSFSRVKVADYLPPAGEHPPRPPPLPQLSWHSGRSSRGPHPAPAPCWPYSLTNGAMRARVLQAGGSLKCSSPARL